MCESGSDSMNELPLNGESPLPENEMCNGNGVSSLELEVETYQQEPTEVERNSEIATMDKAQSEAAEKFISCSSSPAVSEAEPAIDIYEVAVETRKPKKRGKNYPPPMLPSSLPPRLIPVTENYSSDDEEPIHSNIPLSQRRKNGYCTAKSSLRRKKTATALKRGTKNDRDILNAIENPKPSTSAALVREMTRILSAAKDGKITNGTARSREALSSSSHSVDKSVTPKSVVKRPAPTRRLPLSQSSTKKKLNVLSQNKSDEAQSSADPEVFADANEREESRVPHEAPKEKRIKRSAQRLGSSDDENKKFGRAKAKANASSASASVSSTGKRKPDETDDAETPTRRGPNKKPRESDPSLESESNSEPKHSSNVNEANNGPQNGAASMEECVNESGVSGPGPGQPEPKQKRRGRKPKNVKTRKPLPPVANSDDHKEFQFISSSTQAEEAAPANAEPEAPSSEAESVPINIPLITIVSGVVPSLRKSVRERRPRRIDDWIY